MAEICADCGDYIDFSSEGETWDWSEDENGKMLYTCETCLEKLRKSVVRGRGEIENE